MDIYTFTNRVKTGILRASLLLYAAGTLSFGAYSAWTINKRDRELRAQHPLITLCVGPYMIYGFNTDGDPGIDLIIENGFIGNIRPGIPGPWYNMIHETEPGFDERLERLVVGVAVKRLNPCVGNNSCRVMRDEQRDWRVSKYGSSEKFQIPEDLQTLLSH